MLPSSYETFRQACVCNERVSMRSRNGSKKKKKKNSISLALYENSEGEKGRDRAGDTYLYREKICKLRIYAR